MKKAHSRWLPYAVFLLLILEIASRSYLYTQLHVPFLRPSNAIYKYYPKLLEAQEAEPAPDRSTLDILFLGASTLDKSFGNIEGILSDRLKSLTHRKIRIFNIAKATFTSRDNYHEYRFLKDRKFDLVLFYDGINEVRANNCPPELFRDDYSHYSWYEDVNTLMSHHEIDLWTTPYVLHFLVTKARQKALGSRYIKTYYPNPEWLQYGDRIKTEQPFRKNVEGILRLAESKKEKVVLMTFAHYIPEGYSRQRFSDKNLDYRNHTVPIELWGKPEHVAKGLSVHNSVVRDLANSRPDVIFVDQDGLIPKNGQYFNDICHLTGKGCQNFVTNVLGPIAEWLSHENANR